MRTSWMLGLALLVAPVGAAMAAEEPAPINYGPPRLVATLADKRISESSGVACSRRTKDAFWTHNDSGDAPRLYAFDKKGKPLGTFQLAAVRAKDWEDMASFTFRDKAWLLLGDVGDNARRRKTCTLYLVAEPKLPARRPTAITRLEPARTIVFRYEDGPHDCESVAVDPAGPTVYLVSKSAATSCKAYALDLPGTRPTKTLTAKAVSSVGITYATATDLSPDGTRCAVLTYAHAYEFTRRTGEKWSAAFQREPRRIGMPLRRQGESICYGPDGQALYLTSEKTPTPLWEVPALKAE